MIALSTIGVALCAAVVAGGLIVFLGWPLESALVFGALISATDPIAVIALIKESRITGRLSLLIEAESLFNDGAAAVLFTLILVWAAHDPSSAHDPLAAVTTFLVIAGGGLAAGFGVGLIAIMIVGTSDDHLVETALTVVAAFGSFLIAEHFGASGVLASVAAGMTLGNLGVLTEKERFGISFTPHGRAFVLEFWEFAAFLANSLVFLLIGSALATVDFAREGWFALTLAIALALLGRAVAVYPVCARLHTLALGDPAQPAASPVVGRFARRSGSGARPRLARRSAPARRHSHLGFRGRRLLGDRAGADGAAGAEGAETCPGHAQAGARADPLTCPENRKAAGTPAAFALDCGRQLGQAAARAPLRARRQPRKLKPAKPANSITQVDGSGTAAVGSAAVGSAPLKRLLLCNSPPPRNWYANTDPSILPPAVIFTTASGARIEAPHCPRLTVVASSN